MPTVHGGQVYGAARAAGLAHDAAIIATAIAKGESGWNTDAHNGKGRDDSYGLWQINRKAHGDRYGTGDQLRDIITNARAMAALSGGGQNWRPWTVYTSGAYRAHIGAARKAAESVALKPTTAAGWTDVARRGAGIKHGVMSSDPVALAEDLPGITANVLADTAGNVLDTANKLNPFDTLANIATAILSALADPSWWRRLGVGALGVLVLVAGLLWLGRDLITDTARQLTEG